MKSHPSWSPELKASVAAIEAKGSPEKVRTLVGTIPCHGHVPPPNRHQRRADAARLRQAERREAKARAEGRAK